MSTLLASGHVLIGAQVAPALAGMAKVQAGMATTATRSERMSRAVNMAAKGAAIGLGVMAVGAFKSVNAASDLNEAMNKTSVLFGDAAKDMPGFGSSVAKSLGMSRQAALDNAAGIGAMLIPMGTSQKEAAAMSSRMLTLAADLGSFHNADPTDMLDRLRAGLSGESEPLKKFGIVLTEARVKAEALRLGIAKKGATLTESQKLQARYSLAIRDAGKANGDFARTNDALANRQRILMAQVTDLSASLGAVLLPAATKVIAAMQSMVKWGQENQTTLKVVATVAASLGTAILLVAGYMKAAAVATALWNAVLLTNPIVLVVAAIAALAVGLVLAYKNSEKFRTIVHGALNAVAGAAKALVAAFNAVLSWVKGNWRTIATLISGPFAPLVALATNAFGIRSALTGAFSSMLGAARTVMSGITGAVRGAVGAVTSAAKAVGKGIVDGVKSAVAAIRSIYSTMWTGISGAISSAATAALSGARAIGAAIADGVISGIGDLAGRLTSALVSPVENAYNKVRSFLGANSPSKLFSKGVGAPISQGIQDGIKREQGKVESALNGSVAAAVNGSLATVRALQGQLDRINAARSARDRQIALTDAQRALAEARKKGEGIIEAERAVARARQDITVAGIEARLAIAQRGYEREKAIVDRMKENVKRGIEALKEARTNAASLTSGLAGMIGQGVDALTGVSLARLGNSPEAQRLRAIEKQQKEENRVRERARLDNAIGQADTDEDRMRAQQELNDWLLEQERQSLAERLAASEQNIRSEAEARKSAAERGLADLTNAFSRGLIGQADYNRGVQMILESSVGNYAALGGMLGSAFVSTFGAEINRLVSYIAQIARMTGTSSAIRLPSGPDLPRPRRAALGGIVGGSGLTDKVPLLAAPGEGVLSHRGMDQLMDMAMSGRGGGSRAPEVHIHVSGNTLLGNDREIARRLADLVAPELNRRVALRS